MLAFHASPLVLTTAASHVIGLFTKVQGVSKVRSDFLFA